MSKKIILATTSPYRKQAFAMLNIDFITEGSEVDEYTADCPSDSQELVKYLARLKAEAVAKNYQEGIVIGFDSVGCFRNEILEKPKSREEAANRLKTISGQTFDFYTGVFAINLKTSHEVVKLVKTQAKLRALTEAEINKYLDEDENFMTYALGFDPLKHYSSTFVREITGSYNNLLRGIPLETIIEILQETDCLE